MLDAFAWRVQARLEVSHTYRKEGAPSLNLPNSELKSKEEGGFKGGASPTFFPFPSRGSGGPAM